jgi:recombination protein RecT
MNSNDNRGGGGLRDRVRDQRNGQRGGQRDGQVAEREAAATKIMSEFITQMTGEMGRALPKHMTADRMARIVLTEVRKTPLLAACTQQSFGGALMTCAQLGLEPGVSGEAWLLPFKNNKKGGIYEVQLIIGYQGMAKLFWQSPLARSLDAQAVYENDVFDYAYGLEPKLYHKPNLGDRGKAIAYYAVARMSGGGGAFAVMSPSDVEKIRTRSRAKDDGPWKTDYDAMAKKTCVRQLAKLLPRSPELSRAMAQDEAVRNDWSESGIDVTPEYPDAIPGEVDGEQAPATSPGSQGPPPTENQARDRGQSGATQNQCPEDAPPLPDGPSESSLDWPGT